jgi:hypothetical protein
VKKKMKISIIASLRHLKSKSVHIVILAASVLIGTGVMALAERHRERERGEENERVSVVTDPLVLKECGACHMAFQPGLLPTKSWIDIMADLKDHFGDNASLDAATAEKIKEYLVNNAGDRHLTQPQRGVDAPKRITELPWFRAEHGRRGRSSPENLKRHNAKSMADCKACHVGAEKGYYEDD